MKCTISEFSLVWALSLLLAGSAIPTLGAPLCPGNVASLPLTLVNGYLYVVPVWVNDAGPYKFLLDTGTQTTAIDQSLTDELHLNLQGASAVAGIGFTAKTSFARLDRLAVGSHAVTNKKVLVYKFPGASALPVRGILGEDFLEHFDMLLDNATRLLCLDESGAIREAIKGPRTALVSSGQAGDGNATFRYLLVEAQLSEYTRPVRLWLDTGANASFLFKNAGNFVQTPGKEQTLQVTGGNAMETSFLPLPAADMKIASLTLHHVPFFRPAAAQQNIQAPEFDGLLTTWLFRRVFINHTDHFAVLEPW